MWSIWVQLVFRTSSPQFFSSAYFPFSFFPSISISPSHFPYLSLSLSLLFLSLPYKCRRWWRRSKCNSRDEEVRATIRILSKGISNILLNIQKILKIEDEEWAEADPDCSSHLIHIMLTNWQSGLLLASLPNIDGCDFTFLNFVHLAVYLYISSYNQGVIICPFVWGRFPEEDSLYHHHWYLCEEDSPKKIRMFVESKIFDLKLMILIFFFYGWLLLVRLILEKYYVHQIIYFENFL